MDFFIGDSFTCKIGKFNFYQKTNSSLRIEVQGQADYFSEFCGIVKTFPQLLAEKSDYLSIRNSKAKSLYSAIRVFANRGENGHAVENEEFVLLQAEKKRSCCIVLCALSWLNLEMLPQNTSSSPFLNVRLVFKIKASRVIRRFKLRTNHINIAIAFLLKKC